MLYEQGKITKKQRDDFLNQYRGHELDPNWVERISKLPGKSWKTFSSKYPEEITRVRGQIAARRK